MKTGPTIILNHKMRKRWEQPPSLERLQVPDEQDVMHALAYWQSHCSHGDDCCSRGKCFCCDLIHVLPDIEPFVATLRTILVQIHANEARQIDAMVSLYGFGLITGAMMRKREFVREAD